MRKILIGLLSIIFVASAATASGYAVFSANASVNNVAFTTGSAGLQFSTDGSNWSSNYTFGQYVLQNAFPGQTASTTVWVKNTSSAKVNLVLSAQLVSATGDWSDLSGVTYVSINGQTYSLAGWNGASRSLNITLAPGASQQVPVVFSIDKNASNTISGKSLSTNWVLTGTQQ